MSLRNKIVECIENNSNPYFIDFTKVADTILALPEMKELMEKAEHCQKENAGLLHELHRTERKREQAEHFLNESIQEASEAKAYASELAKSNIELRVKIVELKEKIKRYTTINEGEAFCEDCKMLPILRNAEEENKELKKKLHDIQADDVTIQAMNLGVNTVMRWKEDAEKWEKWGHLAQQTHDDVAQTTLDMLMKGAMIEEKCFHCDGKGWFLHSRDACPNCHGTGFITRPATVEELRKAIEFVSIKRPNGNIIINCRVATW